MGAIPPELSLDLKPTYIPKTISDFLRELSTIGNATKRLSELEDFVKRLEEEMRKIDAFKRELPLCMLLLTDAIVTLKEELIRCRTTIVEPVLEEFIPIKKTCDEDEKGEVQKEKDSSKDKMNWMRSVQLWNSDPSANININSDQKENSVPEIKQIAEEDNQRVTNDPFQSSKTRTGGRAFMPFKGYSVFPVTAPATRKEDEGELPVAGLSFLTPGIRNPKEELGSGGLSSKASSGDKAGSFSAPTGQSNLRTGLQPSQQQTARKQRRCWSPELHRRFVNALQQLGGSQVATPKQIRELMQVDGLTNDEVKSHLQKYRLHTRRLPAAAATPTNQPVVVLGGLWMPQDQCGETSKPSSSQSGSPQGPLHLTCGGTSTTGGDSMEEEEDEKSESYSWKNHIHRSGKDDV
ncbi:transcription factor HHO2-like [Cornus florida]|uniref:transcription factor HHO2-like n=1 Tax=Cornus florida TaxID=4283 RepID=UPI002899E6AF|nr:transcription factor HHO2-like [Cornus florida]